MRRAYGRVLAKGLPRITRYRTGASRFTVTDLSGNLSVDARLGEWFGRVEAWQRSAWQRSAWPPNLRAGRRPMWIIDYEVRPYDALTAARDLPVVADDQLPVLRMIRGPSTVALPVG
jgi:hypothetical protein